MRAESYHFLDALIRAPSPSGFEQPAAAIVRDYVGAYAEAISTDIHGNVTAVLNPSGSTRLMLSAHMDEIGFIIHFIGEDGLLHFSPIGGHDSSVPLGQRVWVHGRERVPGVVGRKALHLLEPDEMNKKPVFSDLWIDIGAASREEAEARVEIGQVVTFQSELQHLVADRAVARGFDNKAGVFIVGEALRLLATEGGLHPDVSVHAVATVQEEIGSRGAETAAFSIDAQSAIAVDMGHAIDYPGVSPMQHGAFEIGKGPGISCGANTNPIVFALLKQAATEEGIPIQITVTAGVSPTDANKLQLARGGVAAALIEVPLRYMHTPGEVLSLSDVENAARLLAAYCRRVGRDTDFTPCL